MSNVLCDLFSIVRTDMSTPDWDQVILTYPPRSFEDASAIAMDYQRRFDPKRERWDYRPTLANC